MSINKMYGLIIPNENESSQKPVFKSSQNVFGSDSESDEETKKPILLRPSHTINRQAKLSQEKAMLEDPTVYQYDEIYDSMTIKKEENKVKVKKYKKPRYIENLLKAANKRKLENERRLERQVQIEREKEGDEFAHKEVFVTSAYKKKLEEMKLEEQKEKHEEYLESIGDVTKQRDLGGFYRHIYEQKMGREIKLKAKEENNQEREKQEKDNLSQVKSKDTNISTEKSNKLIKTSAKHRSYRKRKCSLDNPKSLSEGEIDDSDDDCDEEINRVNLEDIKAAKKKKIEENIDADSDFSIDSSSDDESDKKHKKDISPKTNTSVSFYSDLFTRPATPINANDTEEKSDSSVNLTSKNNKVKDNELSKTAEHEPSPSLKPKIDIWKKRTVGELFDQALLRYYQRKAARGS